MTIKIAVIGFGNIAKAIITPLLEKNLISPEDIYCLVKSKESLENIKKFFKYDVNIFQADSKESNLIWDCQVKLLSVKPQQLKEISELDNHKKNENLLVSILAGVSLDKLIQKFPNHRCVRVVTNIPITVGKGLTGIAWGEDISEDQKQFTKKFSFFLCLSNSLISLSC